MDIEKEITYIRNRNQKVEADKAWELSWTRQGFISDVERVRPDSNRDVRAEELIQVLIPRGLPRNEAGCLL